MVIKFINNYKFISKYLYFYSISQNIKHKIQEIINQYIKDFYFTKKQKRLAYEQDNIELRGNESSFVTNKKKWKFQQQ